MTKYKKFTIIFATIFLFPVFSFAQSVPDSLNLTLSPQNPEPGQAMSASVSAFEFNIDLSKISWSLDGKSIKSGIGEKSATFTAPAAGKSATLSVSVTPKQGATITRSVVITPGGTVDLVWEAVDGYTPPFYKGKTLPIKQSTIKVVAIPQAKMTNGVFAKPGDFVYTWRKDGTNMPGQSGLGKNNIVFNNQILDTTNRIDISATNGTNTVSNSISIAPFAPEILFYQYDQTKESSHYEKSFEGSTFINQPRLTLVAEPYFLAKDWKKNNTITFNWKLNGQPAKAGEKNTLGIITSKGVVSVEAEYNETQKLFRNIKSTVRFTVQ
jgi:hypothetical protein